MALTGFLMDLSFSSGLKVDPLALATGTVAVRLLFLRTSVSTRSSQPLCPYASALAWSLDAIHGRVARTNYPIYEGQ